jgi:hypothetical protein
MWEGIRVPELKKDVCKQYSDNRKDKNLCSRSNLTLGYLATWF